MGSFKPIEAFITLSPPEQARFLMRLAWELTIVARSYYVPGTEDLTDAAAVRAVNELQHKIASHALAILDDDPRRYPDDVLVQIVFDDVPDRPDLRSLVRTAFARAYQFVRADRPTAPPRPEPAGA
jgi:hypothetical protein